MLPQTNLQLYRILVERGDADEALAQVRASYDLARRLFAGCYRPSHKPFVCHLVGTAGALAMWGQSSDVVAAGLLHSAYLYGDFGDGTRGATPRNRRRVAECVGVAAEGLIHAYTQCDWHRPWEALRDDLTAGGVAALATTIKLADLCDDCADAGPAFAPGKPLEYGLPGDLAARGAILELADLAAGAAGRRLLAEALGSSDGIRPPRVLTTADRSFHTIAPAPGRRGRMRQRLLRLADRFTGRRAAG